jgi:predicted RNase H-like nuclease
VGVDGSAGAWVAAVLGADAPPTLRWCCDIDAVVGLAVGVGATVIGIDMPIGLPDDAPRPSDRAARVLLGPRRSTLFPTPMRAVLDAVDYPDALARSRAVSGRGLSKQAWNLVPAIRQVRTAALAAQHSGGQRFVEVHPETSFTVMAGRPLASKRTPEGVAERVAALVAALGESGLVAHGLRDPVGLVCPAEDTETAEGAADARADDAAAAMGRFGVDDVLDALAAAWSARRYALGEATVLGDGVDADGLPMTLAV